MSIVTSVTTLVTNGEIMKPQTVRITVRVPSDLHGQIAALAQHEDRSWNWKMLDLLKAGVEKQMQEEREKQSH
jgi:predicted transcriptional regulator